MRTYKMVCNPKNSNTAFWDKYKGFSFYVSLLFYSIGPFGLAYSNDFPISMQLTL